MSDDEDQPKEMTPEQLQELEKDLQQLERTEPSVHKAALSFTRSVEQILRGNIHQLPCKDENCRWHHRKED